MQKEDALLFQHLSVPFVLLDTYFETVACDYVLINNVPVSYTHLDVYKRQVI